jgi:hypothetical protein
LVKILTLTPTFPELRLEGCNGIEEYKGTVSSPKPTSNLKNFGGDNDTSKRLSGSVLMISEITLIPEAQWLCEQEMINLKRFDSLTRFLDDSS